MPLLRPTLTNYTGCSRHAIAAVARCIALPDVLSFAEDSSAARVGGRDSCPKCASISRKVLSCWSSSCQYLLRSNFVMLSIVSESRQYLGGKVLEACFQFASIWGKHFGTFLLRWSPACHLLFFWWSPGHGRCRHGRCGRPCRMETWHECWKNTYSN